MKYLIILMLAGCSTTMEGRSLVCVGFCTDQAVKTERKGNEKDPDFNCAPADMLRWNNSHPELPQPGHNRNAPLYCLGCDATKPLPIHF
jgi:hypothetical protein